MAMKWWKTGLVVLVLATAGAASATTIGDAVAVAGDGKYVEIAAGGSITLRFGTEASPTDCSGTDPAVILTLAKDSKGIRVEFYLNGVERFDSTYAGGVFEENAILYGPGQAWPNDVARVAWINPPFNSVKITASGTGPVYLDAVQGAVAQGGTFVDGTYVDGSATGVVTPLTDDPAGMIDVLVGKVAIINGEQGIPNVIANSLEAKLDTAFDALNDVHGNNYASAINKLQAFINEVNAQRGNKITNEQADALIFGVHHLPTDPATDFPGAQDIIDFLTRV